MPKITDRQSVREALEAAYLANLTTESDAMLVDPDTSSSSDSHKSSSSSSEDMPVMMSEILLDALGDLYSRHCAMGSSLDSDSAGSDMASGKTQAVAMLSTTNG